MIRYLPRVRVACCAVLVLAALRVPLFALQSAARQKQSLPAANGADPLLKRYFADFDLSAAAVEADARLHRNPRDVPALFVRMETAELEERADLVLDSALRLCSLPANASLHELASNRILEHAANTKAFNASVRRLKTATAVNNDCAFNLRLALVAAAMDGQPKIEIDQAARAAGLVTRWRIAGPFGNYSNIDFERRWAPEIDQLARSQYPGSAESADKKSTITAERFWFRDGMLSLPDYFSPHGVFYAAGDIDIAAAQTRQLDVLSAGSYAVFVDGKQVLQEDARFTAAPSRNFARLRLRPGHHRLLLKFTADAAPLSVAVHPQFAGQGNKPFLAPPAEQYVAQLSAYFRGDFVAMERLLRAGQHSNAALDQYLHALLYSGAEEHSPRADAAWKALAALQPSALLAQLKSAEGAVARGQSDDIRPQVMNILAERPESEPALQLAFDLSRAQTEAPALLRRLLEVHASCARLADAVKFYSSTAEQDKAGQLEQQLPACAPDSLQYARTLAESGRHSAAAAWLQERVARNPLHRPARRMLVEELVLSGQERAAALQAKQLHQLAPNSRLYTGLAENPASSQDSRSSRAAGFSQAHEFYVPYRRDGLDLVRKSAQRSFSGGSVVVLLSDKVVHIAPDGGVSIYVHRITRPLNKDGITHYGEIALPRSADLLELRTIKPSGQVIEPEPAQQKSTVSMPALEPGDAIEEEYVVHYAALDQAPDRAPSLTFGSFDAPILYSRLVLLSPPETKLEITEHAGAPPALVGGSGGMVIRIWERENISQTIAEPDLPSISLLPAVTIAAAEKNHDRLRDEIIESTRAGLRVNEAVASLGFAQSMSDLEKAKSIYRFVTTKLDSTGPDWAGSPAEDTLQNGQGSRTSTLLAMARTAGLKAGLLLARKVDRKCGRERDLACYTEPLVRFWLPHGEMIDVDAEADDLPFGAVSPALEIRDALFVPFMAEDEKKPEIVALHVNFGGEKSVARAELALQNDDLVAELDIRLGPTRAQEIRGLLRSAPPLERQAFFEQLAMRIFPGASAVTGSAAHEDDAEQPLQLLLHCTVAQFVNRQKGTVDIEQLVPALGLRALYARTPSRKFPLYIDSLFFESAVFHLQLPPEAQVRSLPGDFIEKSEFGEYSVRFAQSERQLEVRREFRIPVQVVAPEKYPAFARFADRIDEAEHQRISLQMGKTLTALHQ